VHVYASLPGTRSIRVPVLTPRLWRRMHWKKRTNLRKKDDQQNAMSTNK